MTSVLSESHLARIRSTGYGFLDADTGFSLLGRYLAAPVTSEIAILTGDTDRLAALPGAAGFWPAGKRGTAKPGSAATVALPAARPRLAVLAGEMLALDRKAAGELLQDYLVRLVAEMTSPASKGRIDVDAGFLDMGIDSLAALEIRKRLESALGLKLKSTLILDYPSIATMARELVIQVQRTHGSEGSGPVPSAGARPDRADLLRQLASEIDLQE